MASLIFELKNRECKKFQWIFAYQKWERRNATHKPSLTSKKIIIFPTLPHANRLACSTFTKSAFA
ncbi:MULTISPECIES: hypothetical protein [Photorhabdus]|uniref:hypothetical protein n=1 Tax=Photorhabdus TaxID=29487 RepID=UPI0011143872|nr:hypothetical protein [Photorhabdus luminescens]MCW7761900.1 hypothetical protein [Photorhabdus luminescens subsp. venezuelensis]